MTTTTTAATTTTIATTPTTTAPLPSTPSVYWGAWIGGNAYGSGYGDAPWDATTLSLFEQHASKAASIIHLGQPWMRCANGTCAYQSFMASAMSLVRQHGSIPLLDWGSWSLPGSASEPEFSLANIISGRYDSFIRQWASDAKAWGSPFFLRLDWEMNLNCCWPWVETLNGNSAGQYTQMWRHIHDIFASIGASNVNWVWCPNIEYAGSVKPLASLYPGDAYVDWSCLDGYNWNDPWSSFASLFGPTYDLLTETIAPAKPLMIGEVASTETGGAKATWTSEMFSALPLRFPKIKALVWFNKYDSNMLWPIESSSAAQTAFANGIQSGRFAPNWFADVSTSAIAPLP